MTVFAPSLSSVWRQIEDSGLDPEPLFLKHGVEKATIFDPNARVRYVLVDRIAAEANAQLKDPFFGMREAEYFRPAHLGPLGFAWLASANLGEAFTRLQRYSTAISDDLVIGIEEQDGVLLVSVQDEHESLDTYQRDTGSLAVLVRMCRFIWGDKWNPLRLSVAHPEPSDTSYYYSCFRCPVDFDGDSNHILVDPTQAKEQITGADVSLAQLNDHMVVRYLAHRSREDIVNRARTAILDSMGDGEATEKSVAQRLHMSPRQLSRKLKEESTSFRTLLVESRRELAEQYINDSKLSLTEISYLLGFSEASSFSRAYRRWTGQSPTEARSTNHTDQNL